MSERIEDVVSDGFHTRTDVRARPLTVKLVGNADNEAHPLLSAFMIELHELAVRARVGCVEIDFRDLYFMNSPCLRQLVAWITDVADLGAADRYRIRFVTNPNLPWQRRSLGSLKHLAEALVDIDP